MKFKNAMSFKAKVKQIAEDKGITAQQVQQSYLIEVFLTKELAEYLSEKYGKGYSMANLRSMRKFYQTYMTQIQQTVSAEFENTSTDTFEAVI